MVTARSWQCPHWNEHLLMTAGGKCHTIPTYSTSHHLTEGFGKAKCVRQQKQGKLRLGSRKKYLTEIESGLLLTEMRLFTSIIGMEKGIPFS